MKSSALLSLAVLCSSLAVSGCEPARDAGEALFATNVEGTDATSQGAAEGPVPEEISPFLEIGRSPGGMVMMMPRALTMEPFLKLCQDFLKLCM